MSEPADKTQPMPLHDALVAQLGATWGAYLQAVCVAEEAAATAMMLAGRVLRIQGQLQDLRIPHPPLPLIVGLDDDDEEEEPKPEPGKRTLQ